MKKETLIEFVEKVNELNEFIRDNRITALTILDPAESSDSRIHFIVSEDYEVIESALNPKITNFKFNNLKTNKTNYLKKGE